MDPNKFLVREKKIAGTTEVKVIKIDYLDCDYEIKEFPNNPATNTGFVKIVQLFPKNLYLPTFIFRWDEKEEELDVDIYENRKINNKLWTLNGYRGHHTKSIDGEGRVFETNISIPGKEIFKGRINLGLSIKQLLRDSIKIGASVDAKVIRANKNI